MMSYTNDLEWINLQIENELEDYEKESISDGYHTFKELYAHRVALFVTLCNTLVNLDGAISDNRDNIYIPDKKYVWKSKLHADGTMFDGWFIAGIGYKKGETLTYHLPISEWDKLQSYEIENAPEWDGHRSEDVVNLLYKL